MESFLNYVDLNQEKILQCISEITPQKNGYGRDSGFLNNKLYRDKLSLELKHLNNREDFGKGGNMIYGPQEDVVKVATTYQLNLLGRSFWFPLCDTHGTDRGVLPTAAEMKYILFLQRYPVAFAAMARKKFMEYLRCTDTGAQLKVRITPADWSFGPCYAELKISL